MAMQEQPHEQIVAGLTEQYQPILDGSPQAVFIYLDDYHKVCNRSFSNLLGYDSPEDWAAMKTPVTDSTDDTKDNLISGVMGAIHEKVASSFRVSWNARDGNRVDTTCVSVPGAYRGQIYAMLFFEVSRA